MSRRLIPDLSREDGLALWLPEPEYAPYFGVDRSAVTRFERPITWRDRLRAWLHRMVDRLL